MSRAALLEIYTALRPRSTARELEEWASGSTSGEAPLTPRSSARLRRYAERTLAT